MKQRVAWIAPQARTLNEKAYRMKTNALVAQRVSGVQQLVQQKSQSASTVVQESLVKQRQVQTLNLRAKNVTKVDTWRRLVRTKARAVWDVL